MKSYRPSEKVNAGSMADIAFLLLIFFLISTTITVDAGIKRQLPTPCPDDANCTKTLEEQNMLLIQLNASADILVNETLIDIKELKQILVDFIDNNGDLSCEYCGGLNSSKASDNPKEAVIVIEHQRQTPFDTFIQVQNETTKAYKQLREGYSFKQFHKAYDDLTALELQKVQKAYPMHISEVVSP